MAAFWQSLNQYWPEITAVSTVINVILSIIFIAWIISVKKDPMSAWAWCLTVLLLPYFGAFLFLMLGYQHVDRPLRRKRRHRASYRVQIEGKPDIEAGEPPQLEGVWLGMARLANRLDASSPSNGNHVELYSEGQPAYDGKFAAIAEAKHHIHLEYFIIQPDECGRQFFEVLAEKARQGVEVRVLYDAMGSYRLSNKMIGPLVKAGAKCRAFLPLNILRRRIQVNLRNHRKILIVDGKIAFTGGLNLGEEYLCKSRYFGYWRDTHMRIQGPAVADLQHIFAEDWHFATNELIHGAPYFPRLDQCGDHLVQVVHSGPDQQVKSIREIYFAAIMRARKRLWVSSPYFVPDSGLLGALCLAARLGVDVRFLGLSKPDKWLPYLAGRYYWNDALEAGVRVFQYRKGMMHSKVMLVDDAWASVGTANLDNRSLYLNFEVNCLFYDAGLVAKLAADFERDLENSSELMKEEYDRRPFVLKLAENFARLLSPVL